MILFFKPWQFYMIIFSSLEKKRFSYLTQYRIKLQIGLPQNIGLLGLLWIVGKAKFLARAGLTLFLGMGDFLCVRWREKIARWKVFVPQKQKDKQGNALPLQ